MEFRVFPQPRRDGERSERAPTFGKRNAPPEKPDARSRSQIAKVTALSLGAVVLACLVVDPF